MVEIIEPLWGHYLLQPKGDMFKQKYKEDCKNTIFRNELE